MGSTAVHDSADDLLHNDVYYRHVTQLSQVLRRAVMELEVVAPQVEPAFCTELRQAYLRQMAAADAELLDIQAAHARNVADDLAALAKAEQAIRMVQAEIHALYERRDAYQHGAALDSATLEYYHGMIPLQEALLAEWQQHKENVEYLVANNHHGPR
jgi:hypothetical protein